MNFPFKRHDVCVWGSESGTTVMVLRAGLEMEMATAMEMGTETDTCTLLREWGGGLWDKWTFMYRGVSR